MGDYKSKIEGDHIVLYDDLKEQPTIKIADSEIKGNVSSEKKEKKAKYEMDRINNLYKEVRKNRDKILKMKIKI